MSARVLLLPGDGIGPEIIATARMLLDALVAGGELECVIDEAPIGGAAIDAVGVPLPDQTLALARAADAVLLGAVGGPRWDVLERSLRPERGLLRLRAELGVFANLRPVRAWTELADASTLLPEVVSGLDLLIVRELTGGIYFGEPRGIEVDAAGTRRGFNTMVYDATEIERIGRVAFELARERGGRLCSVDKANVLETSGLWREVMESIAGDYPEVELGHMYVDNAAMQLVRAPRQFDVMVTGNLFGDILSDLASMLTGSIGMLPSASLDAHGKGLYEPIHGAAPDIAGEDRANPLAAVLSLAMMLRHSLGLPMVAARIEAAVATVLGRGLRTADIAAPGGAVLGCRAMGEAVLDAL